MDNTSLMVFLLGLLVKLVNLGKAKKIHGKTIRQLFNVLQFSLVKICLKIRTGPMKITENGLLLVGLIMLFILAFLFGGEPDLMNAIIDKIRRQ